MPSQEEYESSDTYLCSHCFACSCTGNMSIDSGYVCKECFCVARDKVADGEKEELVGFMEGHRMGERNVRVSRDYVVEMFLDRRTYASMDGSVFTDGSVLCVGQQHVAFWHQATVYLMDLTEPSSLVRDVQAMIRLDQSHSVAEMRSE